MQNKKNAAKAAHKEKKTSRARKPRPLMIAICDTNPQNAAHIWGLVESCGLDAEVYCFSSADAMMRRFGKGRYNIIFCRLDAARQIRERDTKAVIALTEYTPYNDRKELNILKVIDGTPAEDDILDAVALYDVGRRNLLLTVIARTRRGFVKIPADSVYRIEKRGKCCAVYTTRGIIRTGRAFGFDTLVSVFAEYGFLLNEYGALINPRYARFMDENGLQLPADTQVSILTPQRCGWGVCACQMEARQERLVSGGFGPQVCARNAKEYFAGST